MCSALMHTQCVDVCFPERLGRGSGVGWGWLLIWLGTDFRQPTCVIDATVEYVLRCVASVGIYPDYTSCRIRARVYSLRSCRQWTRPSQSLTYISQHRLLSPRYLLQRESTEYWKHLLFASYKNDCAIKSSKRMELTNTQNEQKEKLMLRKNGPLRVTSGQNICIRSDNAQQYLQPFILIGTWNSSMTKTKNKKAVFS